MLNTESCYHWRESAVGDIDRRGGECLGALDRARQRVKEGVMPKIQKLEQNAQETLQQIANKHCITITVTKRGVDPHKWTYTFCPPEPPHRDHHGHAANRF